MTKNPLINAFAAVLYIILVVTVMTLGAGGTPHPNQFIAPVAVISLFTLSAAVMGYIFCYEPAQLYFDGKRKQAVKLFMQTTIAFGCMTAVAIILMYSRIFA